MNRPSLLPRAEPSDECADPTVIRGFTLVKLIALLLLTTVLVLLLLPVPVGSAIAAPTLNTPPSTILAGELGLGGQGTPGSVVELLANGNALGRSSVDADGRWGLVTSFPVGRYELLARALREGNEPLAGPEGSAGLTVVDRPTLALSTEGPAGDVAELLLFGQGSPGSTLRLLWNGEAVGTVRVEASGEWQHPLTAVPVPSDNEFVAQVVDPDGAVLGLSEPRELSLLAPAPLSIEHVVFGSLARGSRPSLVDGDLLVAGLGEPGSQITLWREGSAVTSSATVADDGAWEVVARQSLPPGEHPFRARMEAAPGGRLLAEDTFTVAVLPPPTLSVVGGETDVDDVLVSGSAPPNDSLALFVNGHPLATVGADGNGGWQHTTRLAAGNHRIMARSTSGLDSDPADLSVALARPRIIGQSRDEEGNVAPGFYGEGRPNVVLEILEEGTVIGRATVGAAGDWACACTLAPGEHTVLVREVAEPERSSEPLTIAVENRVEAFVPGMAAPDAPPFRCPDPSPPGVIEGSVYIVGCGESLSLIATRLGASVDGLLAYNPQLSDPARVYFGQRLNVPAGAACFDAAAES